MLIIDIILENGHFKKRINIQENDPLLAIHGRSGAGKTTLLNAVAGLLTPVEGKIIANNRILFDSEQKINLSPQQRQLGYVFQDHRLFPHMSVKRNLSYGQGRSRGKKFGFEEVIDVLDIASLLNRPVRNLSGGESQRVAIARCLLSQPTILLCDEPLSALDSQRSHVIIDFLKKKIRQHMIPTLYVTHALEEIALLTDHQYEML